MTSDTNGRLLPEWSPHRATWLTWPHNEETWPNNLEAARETFCEMIRVIGAGEHIELLVHDHDAEEAAIALLQRHRVDVSPIRFHHIPTNDSWIRDYGPTFVKTRDGIEAVRWRFNSWGEKYPWHDDDCAGQEIAKRSRHTVIETNIVFEGGSIDVDDNGCFLTTAQNVFAANRGDGRGENFEAALRRYLGATDVIMLGDGIVGDDTDGHVDDITRFAPDHTIVTAVEHDTGDANYDPLAANLEQLRETVSRTGHRLATLPMPEPVTFRGERLPASYANFYIANAAVLVPIFNQSRDAEAIQILQSAFHDREVVGIDATTLVIGLGACHCLTLHEPTA